MVGGKRGFVGLIITTKVRERNSEFFHYLWETGYVQFQNRTKVVTHIIVRYKFLSNFIILVDYL